MVPLAKFTVGDVNNSGKFATGVVDTGGKFAKGVIDTGGAPSLANISANFRENSKGTESNLQGHGGR